MSAALPPWVELSILQLPGREALFGAPMYQSMMPLVNAIVPILAPQTDVPFAFFGHSLGAHVAFEVARILRNQNVSLPRGMIVSGTRAPHLASRRLPLHDLPTPRLIDELRRYGGTPEAVLQNQELMDIFLPPLRADLTIFETHPHTPDTPFHFPITAFGGRTDHRTDHDELEAWKEHTVANFSVQFFDGGHFYLLEQSRTAFLNALRQTVETFT
jgi:medium-chain acyl-[acyl-carrier-protein] hydrolase